MFFYNLYIGSLLCVSMLPIHSISLYFLALMKISGETDTSKLETDIKVEMKRLKHVQNRLSEIEARASMRRIDQEAAKRFIEHGLGKKKKRSKFCGG